MKNGNLPGVGPRGRGGFKFTANDINAFAAANNITPDYPRGKIEIDHKLRSLKLKVSRSWVNYRITKKPQDKLAVYDALIALEEYLAAKDHVGN
jgi:hypothetical protein